MSNLMHELAHAAEFGARQFEARGKPHGFVFRMRENYMAGRIFPEPSTMQATQRELRTFAIQLHLLRMAGAKVSDEFFIQDSAHIARLLPDWWHVPGQEDEGRQAFCAGEIRRCYESTLAADVCERLIGWLDRTAQVLRENPERPHRKVDLRYRLEGHLQD